LSVMITYQTLAWIYESLIVCVSLDYGGGIIELYEDRQAALYLEVARIV
jgi:hypothetical protein